MPKKTLVQQLKDLSRDLGPRASHIITRAWLKLESNQLLASENEKLRKRLKEVKKLHASHHKMCEGKLCYSSKNSALFFGGRKMVPYHCPHCGMFHNTTKRKRKSQTL